MKNGVPQDRLQPDKEYVSVENRVAGPELGLKPPRQQKALKHHAAPPNNQAEHFSPAQTQEGRAERILTRARGRAQTPSPYLRLFSYEATPSFGRGRGAGTGSVPSAVKISFGAAVGDAPFRLLPWKDPAFPRFEKTATTANKTTMQRINNTFGLDMRPPSVDKKAGRLGSGCPPQNCAFSLAAI